ncbi:MAG: hypothetical protein EOO55_04125, partial [Hymenobacter sp.]
MALLINRKVLKFRWADADRAISFASLPELARIASITNLADFATTGLLNQSSCRVVAGTVSGPLKKLVRGQEYRLEATSYTGWVLAGAVPVVDTFVAGPSSTPKLFAEPITATLVGISLSGPVSVSEGASGKYSVVGIYANGTTSVLTSSISRNAEH